MVQDKINKLNVAVAKVETKLENIDKKVDDILKFMGKFVETHDEVITLKQKVSSMEKIIYNGSSDNGKKSFRDHGIDIGKYSAVATIALVVLKVLNVLFP